MSVEQLQQIGEAIDVFFIKARRGERSLSNFRTLLRANEGKLSRAVNEWMRLMVGQLQKGLAQVKGRKARLTAERLCDWKYVREQSEMILKPVLLQVLAVGGNAVVGRKIVKQERFDPIGVGAVEWATEHSVELVTEVATETRKGIRTFIADGVNAGKSIPKIAHELRPVVGLTERYAGAVGKFATELYTSPKYRALSNAQRVSKIERYAGKLHRVRTEMIARTETRNALWEGTFQGYGQMGITRVEGVSGPGACDWCIENIDGKVYTIKEARGIAEASHPACSCAWIAAKGEKPRVWSPAKTLAEAERWANSRGFYYGKKADLFKGANPAQLSQLRKERVVFRKLDLKLANEFNRQINLLEQKLKAEYFKKLSAGEIKFYLVNTGIEGSEGITIKGIFDKQALMYKGSKVLIDPTKMTTAKYFSDASIGGTIRHELNHALKHVIPHPTYVELNINLYCTQTGWLPSEYAEMNWSELWAEWVNLITKKGFKVSSLPKSIQAKANLILAGGR